MRSGAARHRVARVSPRPVLRSRGCGAAVRALRRARRTSTARCPPSSAHERRVPAERGGRRDPRPDRPPDHRRRRAHHRVPPARARHPRRDRGRFVGASDSTSSSTADGSCRCSRPRSAASWRSCGSRGGGSRPATRSIARPRCCRSCCTSASIRSASTSRSPTRPTGSPRSTSPTTSCGPRCRARSTRTSPRCTRRIATASCRSRASRRSRRRKRSPSSSTRSASSVCAR